MADEVRIWDLFRPLSRQKMFLLACLMHRFMLYGGARGGGKSKLLRWGLLFRLLRWAAQGHKNVRVGLFSEDYPTLKDRQISKIEVEFPKWLGTLKSTKAEGLGFFLKPEYGGGAILLRNLDDPSKYQSVEFAGIAVEELTKNPIRVFDILRGSLRWPGISDTFFWGATNPGGPGHLWVKALWIERDYTGEYERYRDLAEHFHFIRSLPTDNRFLDQTYWDDLNSLPEDLYRAWVQGDWDSFEGQAFKEWRREMHVTGAMPELDHHGWRWTASGDWGTTQGVMHLFATGPERSICRHEWPFKEMDPYEAGFHYGKILLRWPKPEWIAMDTPPVADHGPTIQERFQAGLKAALGKGRNVPVIGIPRGPGSRLTKKTMLHETLRWKKAEDGGLPRMPDGSVPPWARPKLLFHEDCKYAIRTIPALPLDEKNPEDVDTDADDHAYDSVSGWLMARTPAVQRDKRADRHPDDHPGHKMVEDPAGLRVVRDGDDVHLEGPRWSRRALLEER